MDDEKRTQVRPLENMSISELESLLQQYFIISGPDDDPSDTEYMKKIAEVILQKEEEAGIAKPVDVDRAWADFQNFYMEKSFGEETSEAEAAGPTETAVPAAIMPMPSKTSRRTIRRAILVAALIVVLIAMSSIPVFGHRSLFEMIATWTEEQFTFRPGNETPEDQTKDTDASELRLAEVEPKTFRAVNMDKSNDYETLEDALADYEITKPVFPKTPLEGFELLELSVTESSKGDVRFRAYYYCAAKEQNIFYDLIKHSQFKSVTYEKTAADIETYKVSNGLIFYLFSNIDTEVAACYYDNLEISISTNYNRDALKQILDKISN